MKYLFWAYTITWLVLFAYTVSIGLRQNKIDKELKWIKKLIDERKGRTVNK